jgi:ankyrin repeat protein
LEHKVDINVTDKDKNTALHLAVKEGNTAMVALLVRYGAKVNVKNKVQCHFHIQKLTFWFHYIVVISYNIPSLYSTITKIGVPIENEIELNMFAPLSSIGRASD